MAHSIERIIREFVRANFSASIKTEDGKFMTSVRGQTARLVLKNPKKVKAVLTELCGESTIACKGRTNVFLAKRGVYRGHEIKVRINRDTKETVLSVPVSMIV